MDAMEKARRLPMPKSRSEFVRCTSIEVALAFMKIHQVTRVRFMGDLLVIEERKPPMEVRKMEMTNEDSSQ
jgi:hypothetical protein